jgi:hypothetical protein
MGTATRGLPSVTVAGGVGILSQEAGGWPCLRRAGENGCCCFSTNCSSDVQSRSAEHGEHGAVEALGRGEVRDGDGDVVEHLAEATVARMLER